MTNQELMDIIKNVRRDHIKRNWIIGLSIATVGFIIVTCIYIKKYNGQKGINESLMTKKNDLQSLLKSNEIVISDKNSQIQKLEDENQNLKNNIIEIKNNLQNNITLPT